MYVSLTVYAINPEIPIAKINLAGSHLQHFVIRVLRRLLCSRVASDRLTVDVTQSIDQWPLDASMRNFLFVASANNLQLLGIWSRTCLSSHGRRLQCIISVWH